MQDRYQGRETEDQGQVWLCARVGIGRNRCETEFQMYGIAITGDRGGRWGDEGLDSFPLFVGEAHWGACGDLGFGIVDF